MSNDIKAAIRALVELEKAKLASGKTDPALRVLTEKAIAAAERAVVGPEKSADLQRD